MIENLTAALDYCKRGFSVIPIIPKDKKPLIRWEEYQTRRATEDEIKEWWAKWPDANVGIVTGTVSGLVVIDIDSVEAKEKLKDRAPTYDLTSVPRSRTGNGWHLFFKHPGGKIPNRAGILPGLDVRGDGGFVVLPPSIHPNGRTYKWEVPLDSELPKLPIELFKLITSPGTGQELRERFDTAQALAGVPEGQRDDMVFRLACKLRSADVPKDAAERLILISASNCQPPFPESTALEKVAHAYNQYAPKQASPNQRHFWPEPLDMKQFRSRPIDHTRYVWDNTLAFRSSSLLVGKPRDGKSTLGLNLALAVSRGIPFLGRETQKSPVLYLSLDNSNEDMDEMLARLGARDDDPLFIHSGTIPKNETEWLADVLKRNGIRLVIVDTMQRFFHLEDSNSYAEAINKMEPLDNFAKDLGFHVMYLHHAGKNDGYLGTTAFKAMCPTYMDLIRVGDLQQRILTSDQRYGKNFASVAVGMDKHGWVKVIGTYEDAQINEVIPKIREFVEMHEEGVTEPDIRKNMPARGIIVSKAIREMFRAATLQRTGQGKKGDPFKYHIANSLPLDGSPSSYSYKSENLDLAGLESEKQGQPLVKVRENSSPEFWDKNGTRIQTPEVSGLESAKGWEEDL